METYNLEDLKRKDVQKNRRHMKSNIKPRTITTTFEQLREENTQFGIIMGFPARPCHTHKKKKNTTRHKQTEVHTNMFQISEGNKILIKIAEISLHNNQN